MEFEILDEHSVQEDVYIARLRVRRARIIRPNSGRKHAVDPELEKKLFKPFFVFQDITGKITEVFFLPDDEPDIVGLKKGIFCSKL